ncbi:MAG: hypothetical protein ACOVQR_03090 [Flavobacterium sp.]|jgi:hypothetical protein|uniref:hypothetical protein n=1 Tax=Flavobacterium sp. TaxID=239 RepID=UPI003BA44DC0
MAHSVLEKLVEYILLELLEAQNISNIASAKLAEKYYEPKLEEEVVPNLEFFPVPNTSIKSFDFALKFALKDIGVILTDDVLLQLNQLIEETWELFLKQLVEEGSIIEERKKKLLLQRPLVNLSKIKGKITEQEKQDLTIASFLEREILQAFELSINKKSFWGGNSKLVSPFSYPLHLEERINQLLFHSKDEQTIPLNDFKAVFDLKQLNDITDDIICSVNVQVEMRNFESALYNHDKDSNLKTRILTLK